MATPSEVLQYLQELEPILVRWYNEGKLGEVATIFGENEMRAEERTRKVTAKVSIKRTLSRAKVIARVARDTQ